MRNWRVLTAAVAAVAAVLAAVGVYFYLNKADQRAQSKLAQVSVLVASQPIPAGTSASTAEQNGWLTTKKVARKDVPPGTLTSTAGLGSLVSAYAIDNGGYITPNAFVTSSQVGDPSAMVSKGYEAMTVEVDPQHGVAGFIQPGDRVSLIASLRINEKMTTAYLVPGLKVLAVGATTVIAPQPSAAVPTGSTTPTTVAPAGNKGLITVEVNPREAEQIAQAYALDSVVYLTLDAPHFNPKTFKTPTEVVEVTNLFDQPLNEVGKADQAGKAGK